MKKTFALFLLIAFSVIFMVPLTTKADGGLYIFHEDVWTLHTEDEQYAAINYIDGRQKMIMTVDVPTIEAEQAVWIFPISADPKDVNIDVVSRFPKFGGRDITTKLKENLNGLLGASFFSQLHFSIPWSMYYSTFRSTLSTSIPQSTLSGFDSFSGVSDGVTVYEQVEKYGLSSELISTSDSNSFRNYLLQKKLDLDVKSSQLLDEYIGQDYSFVVSWVSNLDKFTRDKSGYKVNLGSYVDFPTDKIYYPLRLTSVYNNKVIPMNIYITGHVNPELFKEISDDTKVNYFVENILEGTDIADYNDNSRYTKIEINSPSNNFVQDLWVKNSTPLKISVMDILNSYFFLFGVLLFALLSMFASMLAGMIIYRRNNPNKMKFFLFGLWNFLSSFFFSMISFSQDIDQNYTNINRGKIKKTSKIKPFLTSYVIGLILPAILIATQNFESGFYSLTTMSTIEELLTIFILFIIIPLYIAVPIWPYVWGWYYNRKLFYFNVLFSVVFLVFSFSFYFVCKLVIGL